MNLNASIIVSGLQKLVGLKLTIARRAANMANFQFGRIRTVERGTVGEYALHIEAPWRIDGPRGIVTGQRDLWSPISADVGDNWEPGLCNNVQDVRLHALLRGTDAMTRSYLNATDLLVVERVEATDFGDAVLHLSGGYRLVIFPTCTRDEAWRLFVPTEAGQHLVIEGTNVSDPTVQS